MFPFTTKQGFLFYFVLRTPAHAVYWILKGFCLDACLSLILHSPFAFPSIICSVREYFVRNYSCSSWQPTNQPLNDYEEDVTTEDNSATSSVQNTTKLCKILVRNSKIRFRFQVFSAFCHLKCNCCSPPWRCAHSTVCPWCYCYWHFLFFVWLSLLSMLLQGCGRHCVVVRSFKVSFLSWAICLFQYL